MACLNTGKYLIDVLQQTTKASDQFSHQIAVKADAFWAHGGRRAGLGFDVAAASLEPLRSCCSWRKKTLPA